ncbi:MAG TPA: transporter [Candidatus Angelobacter sp.]|nr:transporter [Candidatus Angelobacter sp.]
MTARTARRICIGIVAAIFATPAGAQSRGVYPLGMSATNSGVTPAPGFTYSNQLLFYARNEVKDDNGASLPISGSNSVLMDMNSLIWVSNTEFLGGAHYSAIATLPVARNDLTSDINGNISGGSGFADSYYVPFILGWNRERAAIRVLYGFLAPTGRFAAEASNNVGSGYWTHAFSSGQTFRLTSARSLALSTYEMYEFHTTQEGTGTHPGDTFDLDYSLMKAFKFSNGKELQAGLAGYGQRQTTAKTGPQITPAQSAGRYAVNALGFASTLALPSPKVSLGFRFFKEFANRSTFQGYSFQVFGSVSF